MSDGRRVLVVGAGLAGSLAAIHLARLGHQVEIYERLPDPRTAARNGGRSINLGLSQRGIRALDGVGLLDEVLRVAAPMRGRVIHQRDRELDFQPYGSQEDQILRSVLREDLNGILLTTALGLPNVRAHFGETLTGLDRGSVTSAPVCRFTGAGGEHEVSAELVVGADGAFSAVRTRLLRGLPADFHQRFLPWGYKEFAVPAGLPGELRSAPDSLHVWPCHDGLIVAHPNVNGSLTATVFLPLSGDESFETLTTEQSVRKLFDTRFPDVRELVPDVVEQFLGHPTGHLVTVRSSPWQHEGRVVLIGDAAHAVYPFYGQGMNSALEDCTVLRECLERDDWAAALRTFQERRKPHTDVLADLSEQNFDELRTRLASPLFLARKKADLLLSKTFPGRWVPLYTMVSHTTMPYADALSRARRQHTVLTWASIGTALTTALCGYALSRRGRTSRTRGQRHDGGRR
ncbi:FAD-dependent oxidoreductase [Amycolatopsis sp. H20-H5]|uniref:FAD-dependent oxidoreductase n=1 Tax=Amycolatopsis sp. H20-H5 TaxID=3046309 RepID=UPI002DB7A375|nr:NAD(P)/FAD-dependent oxidoreductase [Amycolatopsis sp. H20-H5]MEC3974212.1 NAD(P)/FAD-dependent oxidoreductase [Amycolatopsis sp. H20-H5]